MMKDSFISKIDSFKSTGTSQSNKVATAKISNTFSSFMNNVVSAFIFFFIELCNYILV